MLTMLGAVRTPGYLTLWRHRSSFQSSPVSTWTRVYVLVGFLVALFYFPTGSHSSCICPAPALESVILHGVLVPLIEKSY